MSTSNLQVRRATVEDVSSLTELWKQEGLPWEALARRFMEFQVAEQLGGGMVGAVGLQIAGPEGRLHSEAFASAEYGDMVRAAVWERAQMIAKNHGLMRVWTQLNAPFWRQNGFLASGAEVAARLPGAFAGDPRPWNYVQLREESAAPASIEKEFAMFREMEREQTEKIFRQAKIMKAVAALVVMVVFVLILFWAFAFFKTRGLPR